MKSIQVSICIDGDKVIVQGPYSESNNNAWRALGGKFIQGAGGGWHIPDNDTTRLKIVELFGAPANAVEVLVPSDKFEGYSILQIGGYVLAQRRGRDQRVTMPEGVSLATGEFPSRGGSVKSPTVSEPRDTVFRLACRAEFAARHGLDVATPSQTVDIV